MEYESFRPLDGAHDRLSTLILAASLALALGTGGELRPKKAGR